MAKIGNMAKSHKALIQRSAIVLGVVLVLGAGAFVVSNFIASNGNNEKAKDNTDSKGSPVISPEEQVSRFMNLGQYDEAQSVVTQQLESAKTDEQKAGWYFQQSILYMNSNDYNGAIESAQKAYDLDSTWANADNLAQAYAKAGKNDEARKYWQISIDKLDKSSDYYSISKQRLEDKINGL